MTNSRQILVTLISMATFLQAIKTYCDKHLQENSGSQRNNLTDLGEKVLNKHIWKCYLPTSKMGKSREINTVDATSLLENVKHIDNIHLISHYKNLPHAKLENIFITIAFFNYEENQVTEYLSNALLLKGIMKQNAKNGSIDTIKLEKEFQRSLKKGGKITDYIDRSGKHPLASFLGINPRTLKSFGGTK